MHSLALALLAGTLLLQPAVPSSAQEERIRSAESAGPSSIAAEATIRDWDGTILREGTNEWTCLPDRLDTDGRDPWCITGPWLEFLDAYVNGREPQIDEVGFAYMLAGDSAVSNSDPFATEPTGEDDWVEGLGSHLMMVTPDAALLEGFPSDHRNGGPWVMWGGTPYAHLMIPIDAYPHDH